MTITDAMRAAVPAPSYPCATDACRGCCSWPADDLHWYRDGFYCYLCLMGVGEDNARREITAGPTLETVLHVCSEKEALLLIREAMDRHSDRYLGDSP